MCFQGSALLQCNTFQGSCCGVSVLAIANTCRCLLPSAALELISALTVHPPLQALPPEALIPLALLAPAPTQWHGQTAVADPGWGAVLCGDPRQLGPVVRSQVRC